jgi:hypothetical protein
VAPRNSQDFAFCQRATSMAFSMAVSASLTVPAPCRTSTVSGSVLLRRQPWILFDTIVGGGAEPQRAFHFERKLGRDRHLPFGARQAARHFVNRANLFDRQAGVDRLQDAVVISV